MSIKGLYHELHTKRASAVSHRACARYPGNDAAETHDHLATADHLERQLPGIEETIKHRLATIAMTEGLISDLHGTKHRTADLTLAIRDMENASMRLRRELGDQPA